jgi:hypothetical protein
MPALTFNLMRSAAALDYCCVMLPTIAVSLLNFAINLSANKILFKNAKLYKLGKLLIPKGDIIGIFFLSFIAKLATKIFGDLQSSYVCSKKLKHVLFF